LSSQTEFQVHRLDIGIPPLTFGNLHEIPTRAKFQQFEEIATNANP
jgi:hypothetical protein